MKSVVSNGIVAWLALVLAVGAIALQILGQHYVSINWDKLFAIVGVVVTAVAFMVGTYFAVLAVNAYSHVREIHRVKESVADIEPTLRILKDRTTTVAGKMVGLMDEMYSRQIDLVRNSSRSGAVDRSLLKKQINYMYRQRSRLAIDYEYLDTQRRVNLIRELWETGTVSDVERLERLLQRENEPPEIVEMGRAVKAGICARLGPSVATEG